MIYIAPTFIKIISFGFARAITIFPIGIFISSEEDVKNIRLLTHEIIHWEQNKEFPILFYLWYFFEWIVRLVQYGKLAYWHISFEREAHANERKESYLDTRKHYAWIKYL
jgi:hypothetical protein